jgi:hypothetical protein
MRDKKDNATLDLPGFDDAYATPHLDAEPKKLGPRPRRAAPKQEQMLLLEETDSTGLPVWKRDDNLDLTGLPVWAPA